MSMFIGVLILLGVGMIGYAVYGLLSSSSRKNSQESVIQEDKKFKLESRIVLLEEDLEKTRQELSSAKSEVEFVKSKELELREELNKHKDWAEKSEEILNKTKGENAELKSKLSLKEKELQGEFGKNVDLNRELNAIKTKIEVVVKENKEKSDRLEASKHQIERALKDAETYREAVAEFQKKEKNSEWVPKPEFNKLNEEYAKLEKVLEEKEERLRRALEEVVHSKNAHQPTDESVNHPISLIVSSEEKGIIKAEEPSKEAEEQKTIEKKEG